MPFFKSLFLYLLLPLPSVLIGQATCQKYSTWMLESIISRGEGISATDGLLGEIQKVSYLTYLIYKLKTYIPPFLDTFDHQLPHY